MKVKQFFLLILFGCMAVSSAFAQGDGKQIKDLKTKKIRAYAKNALRLGDGYTALVYYLALNERKPDKPQTEFQIAELYRYTRNYKEAEIWYSKLIEEHSNKYPTALFYLAEMQVAQEKYKLAKENYLLFKKLVRNVKNIYFRDQYKVGITSCDFALSMKDSVPKAIIKHLPSSINKPHVEFSPMLLDDNTLVFGSLVVDDENYYNLSAHDSMTIPLRKLYIAKKKDTNWINMGEFEGPFNQEDAHIGNATISHKKDKIYFTICQKNLKNETVCELYFANKFDGKWLIATKMDELINLPNYTSTQPTIGYDSRTNAEVLYFVSNRPGGRGGMDLWYAEYNERKKEFKTPKNMGGTVNSKADEATPQYDRSTRTLYFSSNGRTGFGGYDVYKSEGEKRRWTSLENLGKGINSSYDDLDFTLNSEKSGGFLVSNRTGGTSLLSETCCDDIYEFKYSEYISIDLKGKMTDENGDLTDYKINIYIQDSIGGEKTMVFKNDFSFEYYEFNLDPGYHYIIEAEKKGYYKQSVAISTKGIKESTTLMEDFKLEKVPSKPVVLRGVLYEFDSDKLTESAKITIDTTLLALMLDQKNIIVQISSHTDSKGKDAYNMDLSNRRARSVVNYLIDNGIPPNRLQSKGFGETTPIAPNENPDGSDNPDGRRLNRRTEFLVVGEIEFDILYDTFDQNKENYKRKRKVKI